LGEHVVPNANANADADVRRKRISFLEKKRRKN
jgi:hypothetical protein